MREEEIMDKDDATLHDKGWINELISEIEEKAKSWPDGMKFQLNKSSEAASGQKTSAEKPATPRRKQAAAK
jgi:hypothetical protein